MNVKLTKRQKVNVSHPEDVYPVMQQILLRESHLRRVQEHFWVIGLNNANKILFIELISLGASNRLDADPPDVYRMAIYKLAHRVILVHNHPSGRLEPSDADHNFTDRMLKAGRFLRIEVIDHLIISETGFYSMAQAGIMDELNHSGAWELIDRSKADEQKAQAESDKEWAQKKKAFEIASNMKAEGFDKLVIRRITGLTLNEIRRA